MTSLIHTDKHSYARMLINPLAFVLFFHIQMEALSCSVLLISVKLILLPLMPNMCSHTSAFPLWQMRPSSFNSHVVWETWGETLTCYLQCHPNRCINSVKKIEVAITWETNRRGWNCQDYIQLHPIKGLKANVHFMLLWCLTSSFQVYYHHYLNCSLDQNGLLNYMFLFYVHT